MKPERDRRHSRWDAHRERRRAQLVGATVVAIRRHGAGVGMDEVAAAGATSKTVVYRHFGDRAGLHAAVCTSVAGVLVTEIRAATAAALADPAGGSRAAVAAGIDAYLRLIEVDPHLYRFVIHRPVPVDPGADEPDPVADLITLIGDEVAAVLAERRPDVAPGATRCWGHAVVGLVRGAADDWLNRPGPTTRPELAAHLTDLVWSGLAGLERSRHDAH